MKYMKLILLFTISSLALSCNENSFKFKECSTSVIDYISVMPDSANLYNKSPLAISYDADLLNLNSPIFNLYDDIEQSLIVFNVDGATLKAIHKGIELIRAVPTGDSITYGTDGKRRIFDLYVRNAFGQRFVYRAIVINSNLNFLK